MKVLTKTVKKVAKLPTKKKAVLHDGSFVEAKDNFTALKPIHLESFEDSVMRTKICCRPYLSSAAKTLGYSYFTIGIGNGEMLVVRYTLKAPKKGK